MTVRFIDPESLYDRTAVFLIDDEVRRLISPSSKQAPSLHRRIPSNDHARYIGRHATAVAIGMAQGAYELVEVGKHADEWQQAHELFTDAAASVRKALAFMAKPMPSADPEAKPPTPFPLCGTAPLIPPLGQFYRAFLRSPDEDASATYHRIHDADASANRSASALWVADALLHEIAGHAKSMERGIREDRGNPGTPHKRAFVAVLAEAWMFLTGRRPGRQFAAFVLAAWWDAGGGKEENLDRAIRDEVKGLPSGLDPTTDDFPRPSWLM